MWVILYIQCYEVKDAQFSWINQRKNVAKCNVKQDCCRIKSCLSWFEVKYWCHAQKFNICIFCLFPITVACFSIIFSDKAKDTACCATKPSIFSAAYFPTSLYWKKTSQVFLSNQSLGWLVDQSFDWLVSQSINQSIDAIDSVDKFTLYTLISVCIFSILFSIHFLRCWLGEFV